MPRWLCLLSQAVGTVFASNCCPRLSGKPCWLPAFLRFGAADCHSSGRLPMCARMKINAAIGLSARHVRGEGNLIIIAREPGKREHARVNANVGNREKLESRISARRASNGCKRYHVSPARKRPRDTLRRLWRNGGEKRGDALRRGYKNRGAKWVTLR